MPSIHWINSRLRFECSVGFMLLVLIMLGLMLSAGFWQLDRARQKRVLQSDYQRQTSAPVINVSEELPPATEIRFRQVRLTGRYDSDKQFLLDNRSRAADNGKRLTGYEVLTPFKLNRGETVLVNRGWLVAPLDRGQLPVVPVTMDSRFVQGVMQIPVKGFSLGEIDTDSDWPRRIQFIDIEQLSERLQTELYPAILMLDNAEMDGFRRGWTPVIDGPAKHYGYAVQWFGMALATLVLFGFFALKRINNE